MAATYSPALWCSTMGHEGLNFRVRDGNGCDPADKITGKLFKDELCALIFVLCPSVLSTKY